MFFLESVQFCNNIMECGLESRNQVMIHDCQDAERFSVVTAVFQLDKPLLSRRKFSFENLNRSSVRNGIGFTL